MTDALKARGLCVEAVNNARRRLCLIAGEWQLIVVVRNAVILKNTLGNGVDRREKFVTEKRALTNDRLFNRVKHDAGN